MSLDLFARSRRCHRPLWLRWVLLCTVFSALHGLLGGLVVPVVAGGPVAEICTPSGMQWVAVESMPGDDSPTPWPQGLAPACAWAMAHMAMPSTEADGRLGWSHAWARSGPAPAREAGLRLPSAAARVLLMAPMRAPPG